MRFDEILSRALALAGEGRPALLTTLGPGGRPRSRWMMPAFLPRLKGGIYAVTSRGFGKASDVEADGRVQWTLQSADFDEVISLEGTARILEDPGFVAEVLKAIGPNLAQFWSLGAPPSSLVVLETAVERASALYALKSESHAAAAPGAGEAGRG